MKLSTRHANGYADISVTCGKKHPQFIIEAKRDSRNLSNKDRDQALEYGKAQKTPFVVVTNGNTIQCFNTLSGKPPRWNGKLNENPEQESVKGALDVTVCNFMNFYRQVILIKLIIHFLVNGK